MEIERSIEKGLFQFDLILFHQSSSFSVFLAAKILLQMYYLKTLVLPTMIQHTNT